MVACSDTIGKPNPSIFNLAAGITSLEPKWAYQIAVGASAGLFFLSVPITLIITRSLIDLRDAYHRRLFDLFVDGYRKRDPILVVLRLCACSILPLANLIGESGNLVDVRIAVIWNIICLSWLALDKVHDHR